MGKSLKIEGLTAAIEAEYGVDAAPTNADGVRVTDDRLWSSLEPGHAFDGGRDDELSGSVIDLAQPAAPAGRMVTLNLVWPARGAGAAYAMAVKPEISAILRACGLAESLDPTAGAESYTYAIADEGHESATIHAYAGGYVFKIVGARGAWRWPITAGDLAIFRFTIMGLVLEAPTAAAVPAITYVSQVREAAKGMTFDVGGWTPNLLSAEFNEGVEVQRNDDATAPDAIEDFDFGRAKPALTLTARAVLPTLFNPYADFDGAVGRAVDAKLGKGGDGASYNRIAVTDAAAYLRADPRQVESNDFAGWELQYRLSDPQIVFD